ncbi:MAG: AAA family ATPase [Dehalococcoidia bacterium]|nr:AAA family ATPase [Dehalococcoidia bacterium]
MRIETITLSWFRGAAEHAVLDTGSKSVVVYGANGSGKSTFADAIEYLVKNGKIEHLAHEYSGSRQEKGVRNTHVPPNEAATITVQFEGGDSVQGEIAPDGRLSLASDPAELGRAVQGWEIQRLILRQDEVANFVHAPKGEKYSVLLPLLGLDALERAAENLRQLAQRVRSRSQLAEKEQRLRDLSNTAMQHLPDLSEGKVVECLKHIAGRYVREPPRELPALTMALAAGIDSRIRSAEPDNKRHLLLAQIQGEALAKKLEAVTEAEAQTQREVDALLDRRIAVLEGTQAFIRELGGDEEEVNCPACGRSIRAAEFVQHVRDELTALERARSARTAARRARQALEASLGQVLRKTEELEVSRWLDLPAQNDCKEAVTKLKQIHLDRWEEGWLAEELHTFNSCIPIVTAHVQIAIEAAPPSTQELIGHQQIVEAAASIPKIKDLKLETASINDIIDALVASETRLRDAIKTRTRLIIHSITGEAQRLWSKLHPDERIEDIHLHIPGDADRAIDIGLKFFGVDQPSPRLTLSEGHRNSLGLCIFLALVGLDKAEDRPIVLDDIVSSLDRGHRGMLVDVLLEDLGDRQVLLFTHDREWFAELRARLPSAGWRFMPLRPWESPDVGLQWSASTDTFDDARALIAVRPEAAGNCARAIMDAELAVAAERLIVPMPYLRGDRNDHRTSVDLLEHIISEAGERLRKKDGRSWTKYPDPIKDWKEAHTLLISWANRASHTGSLINTEVNGLIKVCETALSHFRCSTCHDPIWIADQATRGRLQCGCGEMQWRYA